MTDAPEKVWVCTTDVEPHSAGQAHISITPDGDATEYTRTALHLALVAAARREAWNEALREAAELAFEADDCYLARNAILALMEDTDDDQAP